MASDGNERAGVRPALTGTALALLACLVWAGNFITARALRQTVPPVELSFWRWTIAALALAPFALRLPHSQWLLIARHRWYLTATGFLGVTTFNTLIYVAGRSTAATNLALLAIAAPIFMILIARVVEGELITRRRGLGMAVALIGVVVLIADGSVADLAMLQLHAGDLLMLLATLTFAGYSLMVRRRPPGLTSTALLTAVFASGTILLLPGYLADLSVQGGFPLTWPTAGALCYVGIACSTLAYSAWNRALLLIGTPRAGLIYFLVPVFTAIGSWLMLGERTSPVQAVSMVLIVFGIVAGSRSGRASPAAAAPERKPQGYPGQG